MSTEPTEELEGQFRNEQEGEPLRCYWCHSIEEPERVLEEFKIEQKGAKEPISFYACSPEHKKRIINYIQFTTKFYWLFLIFTIIIPLILIALAVLFYSFVFIFGIFMTIGIGIMILPLLGNTIIQNMGVKKANLIGRILGAMLFAIGITLLIINGLKIFI